MCLLSTSYVLGGVLGAGEISSPPPPRRKHLFQRGEAGFKQYVQGQLECRERVYQAWGEGSGVASLMRQSKESMSRTSFMDQHRVPTQDLCSARCLESLDNFTFGCVSLPLDCPLLCWLAPWTPSEPHTQTRPAAAAIFCPPWEPGHREGQGLSHTAPGISG